MGPLTSYKWSYYNPYKYGYNPSCPFIRVITPFITSRGPPCTKIHYSQQKTDQTLQSHPGDSNKVTFYLIP